MHLAGLCPCCSAQRRAKMEDCPDCRTSLAKLRPLVDTLLVDTIRFFPLVRLLLQAPERAGEGDAVLVTLERVAVRLVARGGLAEAHAREEPREVEHQPRRRAIVAEVELPGSSSASSTRPPQERTRSAPTTWSIV